MKNLITIESKELEQIEKSKSEQIKNTFLPMVSMLEGFEKEYMDLMQIPEAEITKEITEKYKRLRLDIGRVRIDTVKLKDKAKEYLKLEDKAIMGVHNIIVWAVKEKEDKLKDRENYFENLEKKRLEALQKERASRLEAYVEDAHERDLVKFEDDEFEALLQMKKKHFEDEQKAKEEAEAERIAKEQAEAEERKRIAEENEHLKKEAIERDRIAKEEEVKRAKAEAERIVKEEAERKAREEKEKKEREEYEKKLKAEREEREKFEREEKAKREKIEAELRAKEEAERKAKAEAEAKRIAEEKAEADRLEQELKKGDTEKVLDLIGDLEAIKVKYNFESKANKKVFEETKILLDKVIAHIKKVG